MADRVEFAAYVRDALAHLYDRPYLRRHPLGPLLGGKSPVSPDELRGLLLTTIESLRPPEPCPPAAPSWRRYRYLELRYVRGATPEQIARELQISVRQSQRERDRSLDEVAEVLWERYVSFTNQTTPEVSRPPLETHLQPISTVTPTPVTNELSEAETIQDELFKIGSLPPSEPISLAIAFQDAMGVVARLVEGRGARVEVSLPEGLPLVRVHRVVLRQVLIDLLESAMRESNPDANSRDCARGRRQRSAGDLGASAQWHGSGPAMRRRGPAYRGRETDRPSGRTPRHLPGRECRLPNCRVVAAHAFANNPGHRRQSGHCLSLLSHVARTRLSGCSGEHRRGGPAARAPGHPDAITLDVLMPSQDGWGPAANAQR